MTWSYKCVEGLKKFHIVADINVAHNTDRFIQLLSKGARRNVITCQWQSRSRRRHDSTRYISLFSTEQAVRYRLRTPWAIDVYSVNRQKRTKRETCRHEDCQAQLGFGHQMQSARFCWSTSRNRVTLQQCVCRKTTNVAHLEDEFSISREGMVRCDIIWWYNMIYLGIFFVSFSVLAKLEVIRGREKCVSFKEWVFTILLVSSNYVILYY